jgi:tol-pal system beta propeller repeat protein TolB
MIDMPRPSLAAMRRIWILLLSASALLLPVAHADLNITVSGGKTAAQPIAIVPFQNAPGVNFDVAQVVQDDLVSSGMFMALDRSKMLEQPHKPSDVNFRNWRVLGQNDVVVGQTYTRGTDVGVRFYLLDVYRAKQLLGFDMPPVPPARLRYTAHRIADLIYQKLTGIPGYFDTQIAYVSAHGYGAKRKFQLIVSDSDGKYPHVIASSDQPLMSPAWSPDGKQLAFAGLEHNRWAIYIDTLATGKLKKLISEPGINGAPAWSPDGKKLAITLSFGHNPDIYIIDLATGQRQRLTHSSAIDTEPDWSPDGKNIVFTSDRGGTPQIYEVPADGSASPQRLTFVGKQNFHAVFSPDGKKLVLESFDGSAYRIGLLDLQSGNFKDLTAGPIDESPDFAPNGNVVIYTKRRSSGTELATITVDGEVSQTLSSSGDIGQPAWSPYGG